MRFAAFRESWGAALRANALKDAIILALTLSNAIAAFGWFRSHETVVLVPPTLDERVRVAVNAGDPGYKRTWALYVALLMGNITPGNVEFVVASLESLMDPPTYRAIREALALQLESIKADSLTVRFEPRDVLYEPGSGKTFVYGRFSSQGPAGAPASFERTYEMGVNVRWGRPWITHFDVYSSAPRTLEQLELMGEAGEAS